MANKKSKIVELGSKTAESPEQSLGQLITEARERKGLTRDQVVSEAHLPAHYIKMIETDNYGLISDQLYLVPFLRRYATFLDLDAEDIASRFVTEVQHADANVVRISQELTMVTKSGATSRIALGVLIVAAVTLLAVYAYKEYLARTATVPAVASPAAAAPENLPPASIVTNPEPSGVASPLSALPPAPNAANDPAARNAPALPRPAAMPRPAIVAPNAQPPASRRSPVPRTNPLDE